MFSFLPVKKLSMHRTSCPSLSRRSHKCEPRKPAPPVTITRLRNIPPPASARATCSRDCRHSSKREEGCSEMDGGGEACVGLVVARGDATELFEPLEAILDEMPPLVHVGVVRDGQLAVVLGRDDGERTPLVEFGAQGIIVERLVADECRELDVCDQRLDADAVVTLAGKKNEADQVAQRICERHDFRGQAAARAADGLIESPPFAPVACRWTLM